MFDAGGATQGGHDPVPAGPMFGSPEWRELFKHTLHEADRLGLEIGLNLQSGWNLGGPMVTVPNTQLQQLFGTTRILAGSQRIFRLHPSFVFTNTRHTFTAEVVVVDAQGASHIVTVENQWP